jgi:hypothetical protein
MTNVKLMRERQERLQATLLDASERLLKAEEFMRQNLLCECDLDPISLQQAREKKAVLEHTVRITLALIPIRVRLEPPRRYLPKHWRSLKVLHSACPRCGPQVTCSSPGSLGRSHEV